MRDITVLFTSCNGLISPSQMDCLRQSADRKIRLVGVDMQPIGAGSRLADAFHIVDSPDAPDYVDRLETICREEKVDVAFPASDEEVWVLSQHKQRFEQSGTILAINDHEQVRQGSDKGNFMSFLKEKKLPCAAFRMPRDVNEFEKFCRELGYPERPVVVKPRQGHGNRGYRIIQSQIKKGELLLKHKPGSPYISLPDIIAALASPEVTKFPGILLMEFLPGEEYSVDVLCKNGSPLIMVPKIRMMAAPGLSVVGKVDLNDRVVQAATAICRAMGFNYNVNIQLRYGVDGQLYPYEVNTRIAASIAACRAAGADLLFYALKLALGEPIPKVNIRNGMVMMRYYKEYYEYPKV